MKTPEKLNKSNTGERVAIAAGALAVVITGLGTFKLIELAADQIAGPDIDCSEKTTTYVLHDGPLSQVAEPVKGDAPSNEVVEYIVDTNSIDTSSTSSADLRVGRELVIPKRCDLVE